MKFKADGTVTRDIYDHFTEAKNEVEKLQASLQLARELIAVLTHSGMMPESMMTDGGAAWRKWRAEEMK